MTDNNVYTNSFLKIMILNISLFLVSNIISSKLVLVGHLVFSAGDLLFPITYILNDILVEIYGYQKTKMVIKTSFIINLLAVIIFTLVAIMPYPEYYINQEAYVTILMYTPRLLAGSLIAYLVGNILNAKIMCILKTRFPNNICLRTILSTVVGELFDTFIFVVIAFIGTIKYKELLILILNTYLLKVFIEVAITPITYIIIKKLKGEE